MNLLRIFRTKKTFPVFFLLLLGIQLKAEEGGSGHYIPGSMSSFVDGVPPSETFLVRYNFLQYEGSASATRQIPVAGLSTVGLEADSMANGITVLWRPPVELGEKWSWAFSATIPYVNMNIQADVITAPGITEAVSSSSSGLGDIVFMPLMFNYQINRDWSSNIRLGIYAPTGDYEKGRLSNNGKNYWTIEPAVALMYFGQENGRELSVFLGADFNTENDATNYQTGTQLHLDGTLAQHLPFAGGIAGLGINGYWYEQVEADSGEGANLGDFKGMTRGVGPALSFVHQNEHVEILGELKWIKEMETDYRPEGDFLWLKLILKY